MKQANIKFTYQDYLLLSDEKRYEILEGDLCIVPAPDVYHQRVSRRLEVALIEHVERYDLGEILDAPCDVVLSQENVVQPDILFISKDRLGIIGKTNIQGPPDLVIEIVSESTRSKDADIKRKLYAKYGVREYWIVDPAAKTVEVLTWSETGYVSTGVYPQTATLSSPELPNLKLSLSRIF
jgi:Uma2 family endonuclease